MGSSDDIIINQHSAIKKIKPSFPKHDQNIPISSLTVVVNELPLYKRATLKDNEDSITIQLINPNIFNSVEEKKITVSTT